DAVIVKTIISMAHHLELHVIAEGVETMEQLYFLQQHLCNEAQGYFFCKPRPAAELELSFAEIEKKCSQFGMNTKLSEQMWMEHQLQLARQDLEDTVRKQQGMTFKFRKQEGKFIHTLCDGELLYRMGFVPEQIIGKELSHYLGEAAAEVNEAYFQRAWEGEPDVTYETLINGTWCLIALRPIIRGGRVVE